MEMKVLFLSFVVGLGVGVLYGLIRVKSPAPPIVALLGLLGMVLGEQLGIWVQTKKLDVPRAAAVCLVGERYEGAGVRAGAAGSPKRTWAENDGAKPLERF
jgi:XapX domain-containing protein